MKVNCISRLLGHQTIALLAFSLLESSVQEKICAILNESQQNTLLTASSLCDVKAAAVWADRIKNHSKYKWTIPLHFINANDSPPNTCLHSFEGFLNRGNGNGGDKKYQNIIMGIQHFIQVLQTTQQKKQEKIQEALKFLIHLVGDLHNPLHCKVLFGNFV